MKSDESILFSLLDTFGELDHPDAWRKRLLTNLASACNAPGSQIIDMQKTFETGRVHEEFHHIEPGIAREFCIRNQTAFSYQPVFLHKPVMPPGWFDFGELMGDCYFSSDYYRYINSFIFASTAGSIFLPDSSMSRPDPTRLERPVTVEELTNPRRLRPLRWALTLCFDHRRLNRTDRKRLKVIEHLVPYLGRALTNAEAWTPLYEKSGGLHALLNVPTEERLLVLRHGEMAVCSSSARAALGLDRPARDWHACVVELRLRAAIALNACLPTPGWLGADGVYYRVNAVRDPQLPDTLVLRLTPLGHPAQLSKSALTRMEQRVMEALAAGSCTEAMSQTLGISISTVRAHLRSIFRKLEARSRLEALHRWRSM